MKSTFAFLLGFLFSSAAFGADSVTVSCGNVGNFKSIVATYDGNAALDILVSATIDQKEQESFVVKGGYKFISQHEFASNEVLHLIARSGGIDENQVEHVLQFTIAEDKYTATGLYLMAFNGGGKTLGTLIYVNGTVMGCN